MKNPCYCCKERRHKCHSKCERYKEYCEKNEFAKKERHMDEAVICYQVDQKMEYIRDKRNHKLFKRGMKDK